MPSRVLVCPLCRSTDIETITDIPVMLLCKCRSCAASFTINGPRPA